MLLLSDGTVLASSRVPASIGSFPKSLESRGWWRLHPDIHGHYVNGLWTVAADMRETRLYFSSAVLQDGRVLVAGGEYGSGSSTSEIYDPTIDTWTQIAVPAGLLKPSTHPPSEQNDFGFSDSICKILSTGNVLVAPVYPTTNNATLIFDVSANVWNAGPTNLGSQNEVSWVKLPDDSILTVDKGTTNSERYIPSLNKWVPDAHLPVNLFTTVGNETGPGFLLPNGKAIFFCGEGYILNGSTPVNAAIYTPSLLGGTNQGVWAAGPGLADHSGYGLPDAPAAMMVNGKILCAVSPGLVNDTSATNGERFPGPTLFFDYDYQSGSAGAFNSLPSPPLVDPANQTDPAFGNTMLALPDGTILFSHNLEDGFGAGLGAGLYVYNPDGAPLALGKPIITGIVPKTDGTYHLIGTGFNGISEGAAFGDDAQMDSNYPLVKLTDALGSVFYARTYNWSSTSVLTSNRLVTTEFELPQLLPPGSYTLQVVVNGNPSDSIPLPHVVHVDRNNPCLTIENLPGLFRSFALANPPPGLYFGTLDCLSITLDPPFPDRPPGYPSDWPWGSGVSYPNNPPPGYPSDWPWPPINPPPTTFGLGGPFRVVSNAVASASSSDRVQIKVGNYNEQFRITKSLTLGASGGPVFIGKP